MWWKIVLSILRWGKRSWRPWIISLVIEILSQVSLLKGYESKSSRNNMMALEKQEFNRRMKLILFNLMRGAFYLKVTRPRLERFCNRTESKPIVSMAAGNYIIYLIMSLFTHHNNHFRHPSWLFTIMGKDLLLHFCILKNTCIKRDLLGLPNQPIIVPIFLLSSFTKLSFFFEHTLSRLSSTIKKKKKSCC